MDIVDWPIGRGWVTGRAFVDREPVHVHDLQAAVLGVAVPDPQDGAEAVDVALQVLAGDVFAGLPEVI